MISLSSWKVQKIKEEVEKANKFKESCKISTTISDLVIGGGLRPDVNKSKAIEFLGVVRVDIHPTEA